MRELVRGIDLDEHIYDILFPLFAKGIFRKKIKVNTLKKVKELSLRECGLKDLAFLKYFPRLEMLNISGNQIQSLSELRYVPHLEILMVKQNPIEEWSGLRRVIGITVLDASHTNITWNDCQKLCRLQELYLDDCQIKELAVLPLTQLRILSLNHNQLNSIHTISHYHHLEELYLRDNRLYEANAVNTLSNLTVLHLEHNLLQEIPDVSALNDLLYLNVFDNPFVESMEHVRESLFYIDTLILDEQDVEYYELDDSFYQNKPEIFYLVSACLMGENCKYNGSNNYQEEIVSFLKDKKYICICPEQLGGLPTPRPCAEIAQGKILNELGEDVSEAYLLGANESLRIAKEYGGNVAIMQSRSPSCGKGLIYDGTFSKNLIKGSGLTVRLFEKNGIYVWDSNKMVKYLNKNNKNKHKR